MTRDTLIKIKVVDRLGSSPSTERREEEWSGKRSHVT